MLLVGGDAEQFNTYWGTAVLWRANIQYASFLKGQWKESKLESEWVKMSEDG